jgi:Pathogenicity locus
MNTKQEALKELQEIPGIGKKMAEALWNLDIRSIDVLKGRDPEALYLRLCDQVGMRVDRCVLYTFRCAVYYASSPQHDPDLLKWWNWKDRPVSSTA